MRKVYLMWYPTRQRYLITENNEFGEVVAEFESHKVNASGNAVPPLEAIKLKKKLMAEKGIEPGKRGGIPKGDAVRKTIVRRKKAIFAPGVK